MDERFVSDVCSREFCVLIVIVVKYGGHALPRAGTPDAILNEVANFHNSGKKIVLVHGGGPQVDAELLVHGIPTQMISGYRATTPEVFEVVQKVLSGQVLRTLVNQLIGYGANAVGLQCVPVCRHLRQLRPGRLQVRLQAGDVELARHDP